MDDNEVFNSATPSPSFHFVRSELKLRRATVGCELLTGSQSCFSVGDIHSASTKSRPKTFFPDCGNELTNWQLLQRSDSSDLSDHLHIADIPTAGMYRSHIFSKYNNAFVIVILFIFTRILISAYISLYHFTYVVRIRQRFISLF